MRRVLVFLATAVLGLIVVAGCAQPASDLDAVKQKGELVVGVEAAFEPFEFMEGGQIVGFDVELGNAMAEGLGVTPRYVDTAFPGLIPGLLENKFDVIISAVVITEERAKRVDYTQPYAETTQKLVVRAGEDGIKSKDDLRGKGVAVQAGTTSESMIREIDEELKTSGEGLRNIAVFDHVPEMFLDLDSGRSDALITLGPSAANMLRKQPDRYAVVSDFGPKSYVGIVTRKDTPKLSEYFDAKLTELKQSGKLAELQQKWFAETMELPDKRLY